MKSITNRAFMAKKKMYSKPQTDVVSVEAAMNICHVSGDGNVRINNEIPYNGKVI